MSGVSAISPIWRPSSQEEASEMNELLRATVAEVGKLAGELKGIQDRQDRHEGATRDLDAKVDQILVNQARFDEARKLQRTVVRVVWIVLVAVLGAIGWIWDHWPKGK